MRSTTETSVVPTRKAMPVSLPLRAGMTTPTALAAPVEDGMMFVSAERPARQSLPPRDGPEAALGGEGGEGGEGWRRVELFAFPYRARGKGQRRACTLAVVQFPGSALPYPALLCPTLLCSAPYSSAVPGSAMRCDAMRCFLTHRRQSVGWP